MIVFLPVILFSIIAAPYIFLVPGGDGDGEFKLAHALLSGNYSGHLLVFHPPFPLFLFDAFFLAFGYWSTGILGLLLGISGIVALYYIGKKLFDKKVAILSSCLLALSGLYISVGSFNIDDFVMTVMVLIAFAYYLRSKYIWYAIFVSFAVLTKETAIFFVGSVLFIELLQQKKKHLIELLVPFGVFIIWLGILYSSGQHLWNEYNFSSTRSSGSTYTMLHNLVTFGFLNEYAYENWLHLFVFNFNWVYTIFVCASFFFLRENKKKKELLVVGVFSVLFLILVLGFQTWTINRYTLPLLPFLYLFAVYGATKLRYAAVWMTIVFMASLLSLTGSVDPISRIIWPQVQIFDQKFFLNKIDGGDGLTYNLQYLDVMKRRTIMLSHGQCNIPGLISYDRETLGLLGIHHCLNDVY